MQQVRTRKTDKSEKGVCFMKIKPGISAIFICVILAFSSCENGNIIEVDSAPAEEYTSGDNTSAPSEGADPVITESPADEPIVSSLSTEDNLSDFTYEQAVRDCEYFFDSLRNDYPFEGVLYRKYGLTLDSLQDKLMEKLSKNKDDMNLDRFALSFKETVNTFRGLAHFALVDSYTYKDIKGTKNYR